MLDSKYLKQYLGKEFDLIGICPAVSPNGLSHFHQWLDSGYSGEMDYLQDRRDAYSHPKHVMDGVRSIIILGLKYASLESDDQEVVGKVARYARSPFDYHDIVHQKLKRAKKHFVELSPESAFRGVVDTAPLLEREFAQLAGLGWQGKNTMLISKTDGSWFFLAALLTDLTLDYDEPFEANHCGTCTACLDACPTDAFVKPYVLDGSKCISYFTIESQSSVPDEHRSAIGDWLFGCDICQEVCPWNRKSAAYVLPEMESTNQLSSRLSGFSVQKLHQLFELDDDAFRSQFRKTAFWRSKRRGILRNAAVVLGNHRNNNSIPYLCLGLNDQESLVRAASAWALKEISGEESRVAIQKRLSIEQDSSVLAELKGNVNK